MIICISFLMTVVKVKLLIKGNCDLNVALNTFLHQKVTGETFLWRFAFRKTQL